MSRRVLLVDDDEDSLEALQLLLGLHGHEVRSAADGQSALAQAASFDADVVVLDIGLPDMSGHEVAAQLRQRLKPTTLLVAATGSDATAARERGTDVFDHWLVKPIDADRLRELIAASAS